MHTIIFYALLLIDIIFIIYNRSLYIKKNNKNSYLLEKDKIKLGNFYKILKIIFYISIIVLIVYLPFGITNFFLSLIFVLFDKGERLSHSFGFGFFIINICYYTFIINKLRMRVLLNVFLRKK